MSQPAFLALEEGSIFEGVSVGVESTSTPLFREGEVVFNTSHTGYQEILTDPSYAHQLVTLTCPHIGNVGINFDDFEAKQIALKGLIVRDLPLYASNWRQEQPLGFFLKAHDIAAISQIDTRKLTRLLRDKGSLRGCLVVADYISQALIETAIQKAKAFPSMAGKDLAQEVTTQTPYEWKIGCWKGPNSPTNPRAEDFPPFCVIAYDFGIKQSILRQLVENGCTVKVVPAKTSPQTVMAENPDGVLFSNGPGDPEACGYAIEAVKFFLKQHVPLFGICLGHQLFALACGGKTFKMKFGHHGGNHPVKDFLTDQVMITSQNHGFAVSETDLPAELAITHRSLFDNSIQGLRHIHKPAMSFQGHPEAGPGPEDATVLFKQFIALMQSYRKEKILTEVNP